MHSLPQGAATRAQNKLVRLRSANDLTDGDWVVVEFLLPRSCPIERSLK